MGASRAAMLRAINRERDALGESRALAADVQGMTLQAWLDEMDRMRVKREGRTKVVGRWWERE